MDHGSLYHGLAHLWLGFVVSNETAVLHEPGKGPLDNPAFGQDHEAVGADRLQDGLHQPAADVLGPVNQCPGVAAIGSRSPAGVGSVL